MAESVYKVIELVGTSTESWEKAASAIVERAAEPEVGGTDGLRLFRSLERWLQDQPAVAERRLSSG